MIMLDIESYWLERVDREEPTLRIISFIKRYILGMNRMPIVPNQILRFIQSISRFGYSSLANEQELTSAINLYHLHIRAF